MERCSVLLANEPRAYGSVLAGAPHQPRPHPAVEGIGPAEGPPGVGGTRRRPADPPASTTITRRAAAGIR